jgi:nicotinamidase/pyrazinamidase
MNKEKVIFWNVDTQVDFMEPDGKFPVPNGESIKPNLKKLTEFARENKIKVINTMAWYPKDSKELSETPDMAETFPLHCLIGTEGVRFIGETSPEPGDTMVIDWESQKGIFFPDLHKYRNIIVRKNVLDVFEGNSFTEALVNNLGIPIMDRPTFIVYGVPTNTNLKRVVEGLARRGYEVNVVTDAIKGFGIEGPTQKWGEDGVAKLITTEQVTKQLETV